MDGVTHQKLQFAPEGRILPGVFTVTTVHFHSNALISRQILVLERLKVVPDRLEASQSAFGKTLDFAFPLAVIVINLSRRRPPDE